MKMKSVLPLGKSQLVVNRQLVLDGVGVRDLCTKCCEKTEEEDVTLKRSQNDYDSFHSLT